MLFCVGVLIDRLDSVWVTVKLCPSGVGDAVGDGDVVGDRLGVGDNVGVGDAVGVSEGDEVAVGDGEGVDGGNGGHNPSILSSTARISPALGPSPSSLASHPR